MRFILKSIGQFILVIALILHLLLLSLFMVPASFLISQGDPPARWLSIESIPASVQTFLNQKKVSLQPRFQSNSQNPLSSLLGLVLKLRHDKFMKPEEKLEVDLTLLDFGKEVVGLEAASEYYFKKPLNELPESQWMTLINLHLMFRP